MRRAAALLLLLLLGILPAHAGTIVSPRADRVTLVIYSLGGSVSAETLSRMSLAQRRTTGLALVSETRTVDLPAGASDIQFRNVSATLAPPSVQVTGLDGLSEQNFDFNLLTPGELLKKSLGQTVHLRRRDAKTGAVSEEAAVVRSGPDGVVLQTAQGAEALDCSGLREDIVFDRLPDNLLDTPTLSVHAGVARAGRYTIMLRYLATGLSWSAAYVARLAPDNTHLDLTGWLTLSNGSETGFADAPVDVVAGVINRSGNDSAIIPRLLGRSSQCWPTDIDWSSAVGEYEIVNSLAPRLDLQGFTQPTPVAARAFAAPPAPPPPVVRDLGDLKLYALGEPTNVAAQQIKQIRFLDSQNVPCRRVYRVENGLYGNYMFDREQPAQLVLKLDNAKGAKLGKALPSGSVAITEAVGGVAVLAGSPSIQDTPVGVPLELKGNSTLAVSARLHQLAATNSSSGGLTTRNHEVTLTNRKSLPVTFEWSVPAYASLRTLSENHPHINRSGRLVWSITLKPHSQTRLRYALEWPA